MPLTLTDVHRIAELARIEIDGAQAEEVRRKLDAILALIGELQAVDTTGVVPMAHAQDVTLPLREDQVTEGDAHALYQSVAPAVEDGLYLDPKVLECASGSRSRRRAMRPSTSSRRRFARSACPRSSSPRTRSIGSPATIRR